VFGGRATLGRSQHLLRSSSSGTSSAGMAARKAATARRRV